ncbi:MAG: right-handed parallel beta-helix repeat-containing protein [Nitrospira sp.]
MTSNLVAFSRYGLLPFLGLCATIIFLETVPAESATYYVATTGSDSNPGTSSSPWRNPQRCTASPIRAGDTCLVRSGTYGDTDRNGAVVWVMDRATTPSGTASAPITIKSEKPLGAAIIAPSNMNGYGFLVSKPYYVIEGFDISGGNYSSSTGAGIGIYVTSTGTGTIIRSNAIHHIGRSACTNSDNGYAGIAARSVSGVLIERNRLYTIGRRKHGESGCTATAANHDHGIYIKGASNTVIRRNVIYNMIQGYPVHVYGLTATNLNIYHNTFQGQNSAGAHILLATSVKTANIKNNTSSDASLGMVRLYNLTASGVTVSYNLSSTTMRYGSASGVTFSNNIEKTNPAFINKSTYDFRLTSSSPVINRGTTSGVPVVPDGRPDSSAYEYSLENNAASPLTPTGLRSS